MGGHRARRGLLAGGAVIAIALASCSTAGAPVTAPTASATTAISRPAPTPSPAAPTPSRASFTTPSPAPSSPVRSAPITSPSAATSTAVPIGPAVSPAFGEVGLTGVNDPTCTSQHRPVVLLHGTFSTAASNFSSMAANLQAAGRCVFAINYGLGGLQSVRTSAMSVTTFIDQVLATTGAAQVDVVAFSQGGLVLRTALRLDGLANEVATAVLLAPTFHGTTSPLIGSLPAGACTACSDQGAGSNLLAELDAGNSTADGDLDGEVSYAVVSSRDDTIVTPTASQVPLGPADRVRSIVVQDQCPGEYVDHVDLPAEQGVIAWTIDALQTQGLPDPGALTCG